MQLVSEETTELKVSRTVGLGVREDIDFTNFTQQPVRMPWLARRSERSRPQQIAQPYERMPHRALSARPCHRSLSQVWY